MFSINFSNNYNTFRFYFVIFNNKERKKKKVILWKLKNNNYEI